MKKIFFEKTLDGALRLYIKANPNSSFLKFGEALETGEIKIYLTEVPENGKANAQLIKFLSKTFGIAKSFIVLEKGEASPHKVVVIEKEADKIIEILINISNQANA